MKKIALIVSILFLFSCNPKQDIIKFTFLQINDVYEIAPLSSGEIGGMARVMQLKNQLIKENPNTYLFMAGDFLNPSLIGTIKQNGERIKGKQMIEVMNAMQFDLVAFGNHEFDLKPKELQKRLNESNFQWISTNAQNRVDSTTVIPFMVEQNGVKKNIPRTVIFNIKNKDNKEVKIGFIAPCIDSNPKDYVDYGDLYEDSKNAFKVLKTKTDVVIGLTHLQQHQDEMIAKMLPEIPLIMGGHEHTNRLIPIGNCKIAKADANAVTAYVHRFKFNVLTKKLTLKSKLVALNKEIQLDTTISKIVKKWNVLLNTNIKEILPNPNEVIYVAKTALDGRDTPTRSTQTNLGQLITKGMSFAYNNKVDCALVNGGSIRIDDQLAGNITGVDLFRVLPYGGQILKVKLKGSLLEKILNYGKLTAGKGSYLHRFNANHDKKTKKWSINKKALDKNKIYTIAISDYLMKGYDIPFLKPSNKGVIKMYKPNEKELANDIRKSVIAYLKMQ